MLSAGGRCHISAMQQEGLGSAFQRNSMGMLVLCSADQQFVRSQTLETKLCLLHMVAASRRQLLPLDASQAYSENLGHWLPERAVLLQA